MRRGDTFVTSAAFAAPGTVLRTIPCTAPCRAMSRSGSPSLPLAGHE
jgi:hypothetical protein